MDALHSTLLTLILSDVVGDPLDVIASGPTVPDPTTFATAVEVLARHRITGQVPASVRTRLEAGARGELPETPKPGDAAFARAHHLLVGTNALAVTAAARKAKALGYRPLVLSTTVTGETREVAAVHAAIAWMPYTLRSAQASLELARNQLSYGRVMAPADGIVTRLVARDGALVAAGQVMGFLVPSAVYVVANFKETQVGRMKPGQPAEIEVDALPGRTLHGRVESLSGGTGARFALLPPDNASGNFVKVVERVPVRIAITDPVADLPLRAGLSAFVTVRVR